MDTAESLIIWTSVVCYALSTMVFVALVVFRKPRWTSLAMWLFFAAVALHAAALTYRIVLTGHVPVKGDYENTLTGSIFATIPAAIIAARSKRLRLVALASAPLALFLIGFGLMRFDPPGPLTPPYRSTWLVIHVTFAQLAYGAYALAVGSGVCFLLKDRRARLGKPGGVFDALPSLEDLDDLTFRFVVFGFVTSAMMIIAGAFWADALWGNYWSWDPVETWSLISWLVYGVFIHLRIMHKWSGRKLAWLAIAAVTTVIMSYWGVNFVSSAHVFSAM